MLRHSFVQPLKKCVPWLFAAALAGCSGQGDAEGTPQGAGGSAGSAGTGNLSGSGNVGAATPGDIGVAPVGRLNRTQYDNTVADLLGTEQRPATAFPADELVLGFDAISSIMGVGTGAGKVTGTATFTQGLEMTTLVLNLTACPNGEHASHLHAMNDCGDNGTAAGDHWVPNGENLGNYTCADTKGTLTVSKPKATWTVGDGSDTDVTKHSFMVHAAGEPAPGGRIGCGVITKQ